MGSTLEIDKQSDKIGVNFLRAYLECSEEIKSMVKELVQVLDSEETDDDEKAMTMHTIADCLFPNPHNGLHGMDLHESETQTAEANEELAQIVAEMDSDEMLSQLVFVDS